MTVRERRSLGALAPADTFDCKRLHCRLSAAACAARQEAHRTGNGYGEGVPAFETCAAGACKQGSQVRSRLPSGYSPQPYRELRSDLRAQAQARRSAERTRVEAVTIDAPPRADADSATSEGETAAARPCRPSRFCSGCGKPLRISSKGELCYRCHVRAGDVVPGRPDLSRIEGTAPAAAPVRTALPDPAELPTEYLLRCVQAAIRLRVRIRAALGGDVDGAAPFEARLFGGPVASTDEGGAP